MMSDHDPAHETLPAGAPRLLTIAQAAAETGLSAKAIARRIERGTLRAVHDEQGRRVVPRAELDRADLLDDKQEGHPGGELVLWRDLYERERQKHEHLAERERELHAQLAAIANAGPIRAMRLRREARRQLAEASARAGTTTFEQRLGVRASADWVPTEPGCSSKSCIRTLVAE